MKLISVPLTLAALHRLDIDQSLPGDIEELELSNEDYTQISKFGVFEKINIALGKMIDEYEDESILGQSELNASLTIFEEALNSTKLETIHKIVNLNKVAIENNTGMFFFL